MWRWRRWSNPLAALCRTRTGTVDISTSTSTTKRVRLAKPGDCDPKLAAHDQDDPKAVDIFRSEQEEIINDADAKSLKFW